MLLVLSLTVNVVLLVVVAFLATLLSKTLKNSNFSCWNKQAGEIVGPWVARRIKSGHQTMMGIDVAGMGLANSDPNRGEVWVNTQLTIALATIATMREIKFSCQKNSGDEFLVLCPTEDLAGVMQKVEQAFLDVGFRVYIGVVSYDPTLGSNPVESWTLNGDRAMVEVYKVKKAAK